MLFLRKIVAPLLLILLGVVGCGDSDSAVVGDGPIAVAVDPVFAELADGTPETLIPTGTPLTSEFSLSLRGTSNAISTVFEPLATSKVVAAFQPSAAQRTSFVFNVQNEPAGSGTTRFLDGRLGSGGTARLEVGTRLSADSSSSGVRAQIVYGEVPKPARPVVKLFESRSGQVTVLELVEGQGRSGTIRVRFDNVVMQPRPGGGNTATGSFTINGELRFSF